MSTIPAGSVETITVKVFDANNAAVPRGTVVFYDGLRVIGQASIRETGVGPIGSALLKVRLLRGPHMLSAKYWGVSGAYAGSQSAVQALNVTGAAPVQLSLTSAGSGLYNLTASGTSQAALTGQVRFVDQTNGNAALGSATFVPGPTKISFNQVSTFPTSSVLTDVNGDGFLDLVTSPQTLFGNGDGTFTASGVPVGTYSGTVADFNRDGLPDFSDVTTPFTSAGYNQATVSVYQGDGKGSFALTATATQPTFSSASGSASGDLNNDGIPDVVGFLPANQPVFFGQANGTIAYATGASLNSRYSYTTTNVFFRDLNGDGNLDVINPYTGTRTISIAFTDGKGSSGPATFIPVGLGSLTSITVDDVNGDGKPDLISTGTSGSQNISFGAVVSVCLGDGAGHFGAPLISSEAGFSSSSTSKVQTGDVDGDGIPDVMVASQVENGLPWHYFIFPGKGDGTFGAAVDTGILAPNSSNATTLEALADVNGDGLADIVANGTVWLSTSGTTATATLSNVTLSGAGDHSVVAVFDGTATAAPAQSSPLTLAGSGVGTGGIVDASTGFSTAQGLHLSGATQINGTALQLTDGGIDEASSAWSPSPVQATSFTTDFHFKITNPEAEGFTFALQNSSPTAVGGAGGELGFSPIAQGVALKFDIFNNAGEGANTIGLYASGSSLTGAGGVALPSNVSLLAGHTMQAHLTYDGFTLNLALTDTNTGAVATYRKVIDIPSLVGSKTAYAGFTASTGAQTSTIQILDWKYTPGTLSMDSVAGFRNLGLWLNGSSYLQPSAISLTQDANFTPDAQFKSGSVWSTSPFDITRFHSRFTFIDGNTSSLFADGFTFTLQRSSPTALGSFGGQLGFNYIPNSVALKFDLFDNDGEGANTTGLYPAGVSLTDASLSVPITGVDIRNASQMVADVTYDGTTLTLVLTDPYTAKSFTWTKVVNLPALLGGDTAFVGFTGGTGQLTTALFLQSWRHVTGNTQ